MLSSTTAKRVGTMDERQMGVRKVAAVPEPPALPRPAVSSERRLRVRRPRRGRLSAVGKWAAGHEGAKTRRGGLVLATTSGLAIYARDELRVEKRRGGTTEHGSAGVLVSIRGLTSVFSGIECGLEVVVDPEPESVPVHDTPRYIVLSDGPGEYSVFRVSPPIGLPVPQSVPEFILGEVNDFDWREDWLWEASTLVMARERLQGRGVWACWIPGGQVLFADGKMLSLAMALAGQWRGLRPVC